MTTSTLPNFHASPRYLGVAETAKILRATLKREFPSTKFSVRSKSYSGGASITVYWTDGPRTKDVKAISGGFAGGRFDGMIDLAYSVTSWLLPDGTAALAHSPGTGSSRGSDAEVMSDPPHPRAELVHFGANYVFATREMSDAKRNSLAADIWSRYGFTYDPALGNRNSDHYVELDGSSAIEASGRSENLWTLVHRHFVLWDGLTGESVCWQCDKHHAADRDCYEVSRG